jgi:hypothetical protein
MSRLRSRGTPVRTGGFRASSRTVMPSAPIARTRTSTKAATYWHTVHAMP